MQLYCEQTGAGAPTLLLLHGMAGNAGVWAPLMAVLRDRWPGKILAPDLRGHGRSPQGRHYGYAQHAADVSELLDAQEHVTVVAHSMGAVVALAGASAAYGLSIDAILGFGMKTTFSQADVEKAQSLAKAPVRWFDTREGAVDRFLKFSGLVGLVTEEAEVVRAGVVEENGRWRLAADSRTFSAPVPDFDNLMRSCKARVVLACGAEDQMATLDELKRFDPQAIELPGLGHNLHVQAPEALAGLIDRFVKS